MIYVIDIGLGNIRSVTKTLSHLGVDFIVVSGPADFEEYDKVIFPGVGSFGVAAENLRLYGLWDPLAKHLMRGGFYLGICLGMQILASSGLENGVHAGLNFIDAEVSLISKGESIRLPHIGWNSVNHDGTGLFDGVPENSDFYFVHSYSMKCREPVITAVSEYEKCPITAFVQKGRAFGVQFHPEKSQQFGLMLLRNYCSLC